MSIVCGTNKVFKTCPGVGTKLLTVLCDSDAAKATCPGWVNCQVPGKALYTRVKEMLASQHAIEMVNMGKEIVALKDKPAGLEKTRSGAALSASAELLPSDFRQPVIALIDVVLALSDLDILASSGLAASADTEAHAKKLSSAMKTLNTDQSIQDQFSEPGVVNALIALMEEAEKALKTCQTSSEQQHIVALRKVVDACLALCVAAPDPSKAENPFLTYMKNKGGSINRAMKEVRICIITDSLISNLIKTMTLNQLCLV